MFRRDDCERRERQRQMKNDEAQPSPEAAREEFFRGVSSEAPTEPLAARGSAPTTDGISLTSEVRDRAICSRVGQKALWLSNPERGRCMIATSPGLRGQGFGGGSHV